MDTQNTFAAPERWRILLAAGILLTGSLTVLCRGPQPQVRQHPGSALVSTSTAVTPVAHAASENAETAVTRALAEVQHSDLDNLRSYQAIQLVTDSAPATAPVTLAQAAPAWLTGRLEE